MNVYVINLDRSPERLQFIEQQAADLGIAFERVSAVDGRQMSVEQIRERVSETYEFQPLNAGEVGVFMSHRLAWTRLLQSGHPHAAVFEDDVLFSSSLKDVLARIETIPNDFDIIKMETTLRTIVCNRAVRPLGQTHHLQQLLSWHGGAAGYVISAMCAKRLLDLTTKLADPVDQILFNPMSTICSKLNILQLAPATCIQKDILDEAIGPAFGTTIDRHVSKGRLFRHGPLIDLRRMLKKQVERQRRKWLALKSINVQLIVPFGQDRAVRRSA